jgi:hypothetical protein
MELRAFNLIRKVNFLIGVHKNDIGFHLHPKDLMQTEFFLIFTSKITGITNNELRFKND